MNPPNTPNDAKQKPDSDWRDRRRRVPNFSGADEAAPSRFKLVSNKSARFLLWFPNCGESEPLLIAETLFHMPTGSQELAPPNRTFGVP